MEPWTSPGWGQTVRRPIFASIRSWRVRVAVGVVVVVNVVIFINNLWTAVRSLYAKVYEVLIIQHRSRSVDVWALISIESKSMRLSLLQNRSSVIVGARPLCLRSNHVSGTSTISRSAVHHRISMMGACEESRGVPLYLPIYQADKGS